MCAKTAAYVCVLCVSARRDLALRAQHVRGGTTEVPRYGELYAEYLHDYLKATKIAILNGREEYPKNEGDALTAQLKNWYQVAPVKRAEFNIGDKDFTPQLLEIQGANPQVIAIFGNPAEAAIAMRQAKELGMNEQFFLGTTMVDQSLLNIAKRAAEGASGFALLPLLPSSSNPEMKAWVAKWKQEYPDLPAGRPNVFDVLSYTDMYVVANALKRAGKDLRPTSLSTRSKPRMTIESARSLRRSRSPRSITSAICACRPCR